MNETSVAAGKIYDVEVTATGAKGDGIAETPEGRIFIPYTVPGDRRRVRVGRDGRAAVIERLEDGPGRQRPVCPHFGACGGCALQHLEHASYLAWKRHLVVKALARRAIKAEVAPVISVPPGSRRRVRLNATPVGNGAVVGFRERRSHDIVGITDCPVSAASVVGLLAPLGKLAAAILTRRSQAEVVVTRTASGLDVLIQTGEAASLAVRERLAQFAETVDLARLSWMTHRTEAEPVATRRPVRVAFGQVGVALPPVSFLQPTEEGEAALRSEISRALAGSRRIADLYAGCGAFALPLAASGAAVFAADTDRHALAALEAAARESGFGARVETEARQLSRRPLVPEALSRFDGVVLDPPRVGAEEQAKTLAASVVPVVAYASCNPATFARDARILIDGGFVLDRVAPVDQFLWSPHVELVGIFRR